MNDEYILNDLLEMKLKINYMINNIIKRIDKTKLNDEIKNKPNKENNFDCNITLFDHNKNHYNKNVNKTMDDIKEYYNIYISIIDTEFKKGNKINIQKIGNYVENSVLENGKKYNNNIKIEGDNGKLKKTGSNKQNHKNKIVRSVKLYNIYEEKLKYIYFSLNIMSRLNEKKWNEWLQYLELFIINNKI